MSEPDTPWGLGLVTATIAAVLTGTLFGSLGAALARINGVFALALLVIVIGGAAPSVWRFRREPVWRWVIPGSAVGSAAALVTTLAAW